MVDEIAQGKHGIMVMGKGGVGKTTIAAAIAVGLAKRGMPSTSARLTPQLMRKCCYLRLLKPSILRRALVRGANNQPKARNPKVRCGPRSGGERTYSGLRPTRAAHGPMVC